jgi:hypothetical protein
MMIACLGHAQAGESASKKPSGRVCLAPMVPQSAAVIGKFPAGEAPRSGYSVRIDSSDAVLQSTTSIHWFSDLELKQSHSVLIHGDGKRVAKFTFTFEEYDFKKNARMDLCLFQNDLYLTWQLWPVERTDSWCPCWSSEK